MGIRNVVICVISILIIASGLRVLFNLTSQDIHLTSPDVHLTSQDVHLTNKHRYSDNLSNQDAHLTHKHYSDNPTNQDAHLTHKHSSDSPTNQDAHLTHKHSSDKTLTRLGNALNFSYSSCPRSSIMLNPKRLNANPLHNSCPRVFIIGARKGGTTSLYQYLSKHPDFGGVLLNKGPSAGETFYFSAQYNKRTWEDYVSQFPPNKMSGDSSVGNLVDCKVPERLYTNCGRQAKVIILLRDPLERYQSNFRMRARLHTVNTEASSRISNLLTTELQSLYKSFTDRNVDTSDLSDSVNKLSCLYRPAINCIYEGMYYIHLHNWLCNFPAENILILSTKEFQNSSQRIFSQVLEFVGLKPLDDGIINTITEVKYNNGGKVEDEPDYRLLSLSDKEKLQRIYAPLNEKLFDLLKWHDVDWSDK